ncbi:hypothetical protein C8A03DRAFT_19425 [Achaetomium macrosporum]|uniref:Zn(2)-C6 fungal-type domain-containing protein n=1 Tax=Achaetomium macrosporum TaxID=79813 RepID=A0AAN7C1S5_9PEZI|nr:hypothetical protein C8A03DRAFT_19425 [Achaetomium macrosporum]
MASYSTGPSHTGRFPTRIRRQRRACVQCTRAKRKCGKEAPSCARCSEKGIVCTYPPRPDISTAGADTRIEHAEEEAGDGAALAHSSRHPYSSASNASVSRCPACNCRWFLSAESWTLHHGSLDGAPSPVSEQSLLHFISKIKAWAAAWVRDGHSPLMHKHLYGSWVPDCIQDCLTSLAAYNTASSHSAKATALHIVDDRVNRLVQSQPPDDDYELDGITSSILLTTATHLARTQALYVYQLIRLFDGDIRARAQAERHMATLLTWAKQMVESARLDCASAELLPGPTLSSSDTNSNSNPFTLPANPRSTPIPSLWRAWITAESVRRIYTAAVFLLNVYDTLRRGWSVCPGMIAFTAQSGLWDAGSGYAWVETLRARAGLRGRGRSTLTGSERILQNAAPEEIDEFAVAVLEITFGTGSVEKWVFEKGEGGKGV